MIERTILVMHASEDATLLPQVDKLFRQFTNGRYRGQIRFRIQSATPSGALADEIRTAYLTVALLTTDFAASPWMQAYLKAALLARHSGSKVLPFHIEQIEWPHEKVVMLPRNKAVSQYSSRERGWYDIAVMVGHVLTTLDEGGTS